MKADDCSQSESVSRSSRITFSATNVVVVSSPLSIWRILLSTPLAVLSYFLIWYVPPYESGKVIWYLFFYCIFQSLQTVSTTLVPMQTLPVTTVVPYVQYRVIGKSLISQDLNHFTLQWLPIMKLKVIVGSIWSNFECESCFFCHLPSTPNSLLWN